MDQPDHQSRGAELPAVVRSDFHNLLDRKLDVDAAAEEIQIWSDKMRDAPIRRWHDIPENGRELFRLMVYRIACALVGESELLRDPQKIVDVVREEGDRVFKSGAMPAGVAS